MVNTKVDYNAVCCLHNTLKNIMHSWSAWIESYVPRSYEEAMLDKEWSNLVRDEVEAMIKNDTWKYLANGKIDRKKTRLVE